MFHDQSICFTSDATLGLMVFKTSAFDHSAIPNTEVGFEPTKQKSIA